MTRMSRKPRILLVNEASFLATGYSTYGMEVMQRLHAAERYELAELACYAKADDPRRHDLPWKFFGNDPSDRDRPAFDRCVTNQFGEWEFEDAVLEFQPDIVFDIRDQWMFEFQERSPHRRHFHWCVMPTVDSTPQMEQWIATFISADRVLTYTDWGQGVLRREGGGLINLAGTAPPGADLATFRPMDRSALRKQFKMDPEALLLGTVMRNQPRKLYPQLISDFAAFLQQAPPALAKRSYLYLHTSYPDRDGWDIPRLIKQSGIGCRILVTYKCKTCGMVFPAFFQDARGACVRCGSSGAVLPNVAEAVDRLTLATIMNLFDAYVQYANSEGFGMPQVEAAACGLPVLATDYSAMGDVARKVHGFPIDLISLDPEPESGCMRAKPSRADFVRTLINVFSMSEEKKQALSKTARRAVEDFYTWDQTVTRWTETFDSLPLREAGATWASPPLLHTPKPVPPEFPSSEEFVEWAITNVLGRPEMANSYMALRMIRDLNWGSTLQGAEASYHNESSLLGTRQRTRPFGTDQVLEELTRMCEAYNAAETRRASRAASAS